MYLIAYEIFNHRYRVSLIGALLVFFPLGNAIATWLGLKFFVIALEGFMPSQLYIHTFVFVIFGSFFHMYFTWEMSFRFKVTLFITWKKRVQVFEEFCKHS